MVGRAGVRQTQPPGRPPAASLEHLSHGNVGLGVLTTGLAVFPPSPVFLHHRHLSKRQQRLHSSSTPASSLTPSSPGWTTSDSTHSLQMPRLNACDMPGTPALPNVPEPRRAYPSTSACCRLLRPSRPRPPRLPPLSPRLLSPRLPQAPSPSTDPSSTEQPEPSPHNYRAAPVATRVSPALPLKCFTGCSPHVVKIKTMTVANRARDLVLAELSTFSHALSQLLSRVRSCRPPVSSSISHLFSCLRPSTHRPSNSSSFHPSLHPSGLTSVSLGCLPS